MSAKHHGSAKESLKAAGFWPLPIHVPKPKTAIIPGIPMCTINTLTMRSARNTKRCITLPQTVPATWKWKKKIPLRGKRRGVLSTDFLSMLLFSLWKCKSPLWRKAKTDFFINWDTREGVFLCVYIYFGCRISVLDNKKDAFASSCTTYCSPAEAVDSDHSYLNLPCNSSCYYITTRTNVCQAIS